MFYDVFKMLCEKKGVSCNRAAMDIGLSNSTPTKWKKTGANPDSTTLSKISSYFGVTPDYLLGFTNDSGIITRYKISDWISVKRKMPEIHAEICIDGTDFFVSEDVLVCYVDEYGELRQIVANFELDETEHLYTGWCESLEGAKLNDVTHWMPLPELPDADAAYRSEVLR